jgi:hypothetical protein
MLMTEAKQLAAARGETLTALFERALREMLTRRKKLSERPSVRLPTFRGRGLQAGVDLDDGAALLDLMEKDERVPG